MSKFLKISTTKRVAGHAPASLKMAAKTSVSCLHNFCMCQSPLCSLCAFAYHAILLESELKKIDEFRLEMECISRKCSSKFASSEDLLRHLGDAHDWFIFERQLDCRQVFLGAAPKYVEFSRFCSPGVRRRSSNSFAAFVVVIAFSDDSQNTRHVWTKL